MARLLGSAQIKHLIISRPKVERMPNASRLPISTNAFHNWRFCVQEQWRAGLERRLTCCLFKKRASKMARDSWMQELSRDALHHQISQCRLADGQQRNVGPISAACVLTYFHMI